MTQMTIDQALALAQQRHQAGQMAEAEAIYRQVLAAQPNHAGALHLLGMLAYQAGQWGAAVELIGKSVELEPNSVEAHNNLGVAFQRLGRIDESVAAHRRAIELRPHSGSAYYNLGVAFRSAGRHSEAIGAFQDAIQRLPDSADAYNNLGNCLRDLGRQDDAITAYRRAIEVKPYHAPAHNNLGTVLREVGLLDEAIDEHRRAMELNPQSSSPHDNLILALQYHPAADAGMINAELNRWNERFGEPFKKFIQPHANDRAAERRLRVGYISADFRQHACANFLLPLLRSHEHEHFEITCYAQVPNPDSVTALFEKAADRWRPISGVPDAQLADLIRHDAIDILIDAMGHTSGNRLAVLARKPAPVLASWMGYVGVTGLGALDYRITDALVCPEQSEETGGSERPIRLPDSLWCYDPMASEPPVNPLPALRNGFITFGCLNNFAKINAPVVAAWARILQAVEGSRLLVLTPEGSARQKFTEGMASVGIEPQRLTFASKSPRAAYLESYHQLDISLDPFPYNGHTTSLDSLWMGVPVVTLTGWNAAGRIGLSHAANLKMNELVAGGVDEYVRIAAALAGDQPRLAAMRENLRPRMEMSPLMDAPRFAGNMEAVYRRMWRTWCTG